MITNLDTHTGHKRELKKIRRQFIHRQPDEEDNEPPEQDLESPLFRTDKMYMINPCLGLVELNRKICMGTQFLNPYYHITNLTIDEKFSCKAVTLNLCANDKTSLVPWEHTASRLESYGDPELAAWACRIRNYYSNYPNIMAKYFELLASDSPKASISIRKTKLRAVLASKEIESKCAYRKLLTYSTRNSTEILSSTYSEGILKEMGFTIDTFVPWTKENGLPTLFESECSTHLDIAKNFLDCMVLNSGPIQEGPEYVTFLYDKDGYKKEVLAQYVTVVEPTPEGFFGSGYFIMKKSLGNSGVPGQEPKEVGLYSKPDTKSFDYVNQSTLEQVDTLVKDGNMEKMEVEEL